MPPSLRAFAPLGLLLGSILSLSAQREPEVLVVGETFDRPLSETRPTPGHPIYYYLIGGAQLDLGGKIRGEQMPLKSDLENLIHQTLASQGFRRAEKEGPEPELIVSFAYGTVAVDLNEWDEAEIDLTVEDAVDTSEYLKTNEYANGGEIRHLVGASRMFNRRMDYKTAQLFKIALQNDRLYITVSAMSAEALRRQERDIVWRTRISIELDRNSLPKFMNVMLASAAPFLGAETDVPVFLGERDRRNTDVQIGELEVVEPESP